MKARDARIAAMIAFFALGMVLPATQSSGHPRPLIQTALDILFILDSPLKKWNVDDSLRVVANITTTLLWGLLVGFWLSKLSWLRRRDMRNEATREPIA